MRRPSRGWTRPGRLVSVGSIVADICVVVPQLPLRGGDVLASAATLMAGGGFNVLAAAARQGLPAMFAGRHGSGPYGACIRAALVREGIEAWLPPATGGDSGFCLVMVEPDGERSFVTSPGVESFLGARDLAEIPIRNNDAVFVSGYDLAYPALGPAIAAWLHDLPPSHLLVVDPGPLVADIPATIRDAVLSRAGVLTLNRREACVLAGTSDTDDILLSLRPRLSREALLVLRDGAAGCVLAEGSLPSHRVPSPSVVATDTTGAGDTHTGVLIAAIGAGHDLVSAARRANAAAAYSVTRRGGATAPDSATLDALLVTDQSRPKHSTEIVRTIPMTQAGRRP